MKSTIISMLIVLMVMVAVPMFIMKDGDMLEKLGFGGSTDNLKASAPKNVQAVKTDKRIEVYKWRDENGVMQFSQTPPQSGGSSEKMVLSPDTNVIDALKVTEKKEEAVSRGKVVSLRSPYSPGGVKDLIKGTKDVQQQLNEQQAQKEKMMKEMFK